MWISIFGIIGVASFKYGKTDGSARKNDFGGRLDGLSIFCRAFLSLVGNRNFANYRTSLVERVTGLSVRWELTLNSELLQ